MGQRLVSSNITPSANTVQIYRGQSKTLEVVVKDDSCNPVDLTGATVFFSVKMNSTDPTALITKSSTDSTQILILTPTINGIAQIFIKPLDTQYLEIDTYIFDVWVQLPSGNRYPVIPISEFIIQAGVTSF